MSRVTAATLVGVDGVAVEVEVRISSQLPRVDVVGLPEMPVFVFMELGGLKHSDRHVEGIVEVMLDATREYDHPPAAGRLDGEMSAFLG